MIETVHEFLQTAILGCGVFVCEKAFKVSKPMSGCLVLGATECSYVLLNCFLETGSFPLYPVESVTVLSWKYQKKSCFEETEVAFPSPHQNAVVVATLKSCTYKNTVED